MQVRVEAPSCLTLEMHLSDKLRASYPILHMCYRISLAVLAGAFPLAGVATTPDAVTQVRNPAVQAPHAHVIQLGPFMIWKLRL